MGHPARGRFLDGKDELIFISIAAYRDPQLAPTVMDCIAKASKPERLRFGICWQRDEQEAPLPFSSDPRFRLLEVDWRESKGACWARAEIMKLWQGEAWYLQVDSHCRFAGGWDETLLRTVAATGSEKPILSTYASPFTPGEDEVLRGDPLQIAFQAFSPDGIPQLKPAGFTVGPKPQLPVRARFVSAGFLFTSSRFVEEVPYDPELYFMGEESAMTVRAYTYGYDLFHPVETIVWHDYIRANAKRHWGDHTEQNNMSCPWSELDEKSRLKVRRLLRGEPVESFGLGPVRTLKDYEAYAGVSFRLRRVQQYTMRAEEPPNPDAVSDWADWIYPWIVKVMVKRALLPEGSLDDPTLWYLGIYDDQGLEIYRWDMPPTELAPLRGNQEEIALICEFSSGTIPASWSVWPVNRSRGWLRKIEGQLEEGDFVILKEDGED